MIQVLEHRIRVSYTYCIFEEYVLTYSVLAYSFALL